MPDLDRLKAEAERAVEAVDVARTALRAAENASIAAQRAYFLAEMGLDGPGPHLLTAANDGRRAGSKYQFEDFHLYAYQPSFHRYQPAILGRKIKLNGQPENRITRLPFRAEKVVG